MKKIFISYKFEDKDYVNGLKGMIKNTNNNLVACISMEEEDVRVKGKEQVKSYIKEKMKPANVLILLLGKDTHSSLWVQYELDVANQWNLPIIVVKLSMSYGELKNLRFGNQTVKFSEYNVDSLKSAIDSI